MLTLPLSAPPAVGLKTTVNDALCPEFKVRGKASPLRLNPALAVADEIVRLLPPELVSVAFKFVVLPT